MRTSETIQQQLYELEKIKLPDILKAVFASLHTKLESELRANEAILEAAEQALAIENNLTIICNNAKHRLSPKAKELLDIFQEWWRSCSCA